MQKMRLNQTQKTAVLKWIVFLKRQNRWQMLSFRLQKWSRTKRENGTKRQYLVR